VTVTPLPSPTEIPRPYEHASLGTPIFIDSFENPLRFDIGAGNPNRWDGLSEDGTDVVITPLISIIPEGDSRIYYDPDGVPIQNVLAVIINDNPVKHPDWDGGQNLDWWAGYPFWANTNKKNMDLPCAVQVDLLKSPKLEASFLSVHRQKTGTWERNSVAAIEFGPENTPRLYVTSPVAGTRMGDLSSRNFDPETWNRIRIEFRQDGNRLYAFPYINGVLALKKHQEPFRLDLGGSTGYEGGFIDAHPGYNMGATAGGYRPKPGEFVLNRNFLVETDLSG
jgi:hypothetical protein